VIKDFDHILVQNNHLFELNCFQNGVQRIMQGKTTYKQFGNQDSKKVSL
jgi:hypothetical protein